MLHTPLSKETKMTERNESGGTSVRLSTPFRC
jgi:hypothetical protein